MVSPYSWKHPGGVNNHVAGLASEMIRRGHGVTIIAPDSDGVPPRAHFLSAGRSLPVPANGSIARLALFPGTGARVAGFMGGDFDVVHVHEPLVPAVSTAAVRSTRCRVVGTFHAAAEGRSFAYALAKVFYSRVHARLDVRIAVSESAKALVSGRFPGEYLVIPNGVDTERFSPGGRRAPSPSAHPSILFVGRNEKRKGIDVLIKAFPAISSRIPGCRLTIAGSGCDEGLLARLPSGMREMVRVRGFVGGEELPDLYRSADLFCAPALEGESFGVVLLEAMACGTPVLASDIPGYRELVKGTGGGMLFRKGDEQDMARMALIMLEDQRLLGELSTRGLSGAQAYSWRVLGERLEGLYRGDYC